MTAPSEDAPAPGGLLLRRLIVLAPLAVFVALAGLFFIRLFAGDPSKIPSALIGQPAPEFTLPAVEGLTKDGASVPGLATGDLKGEVTVVNVWASWCLPCRDENPMLLELEERGYRVVGINYKDTAANARRFLGEFGNPFSAVGTDRRGMAAIDWGVYGVPETFIVDATGAIIHKHVGPFGARDLRDSIIPVLEQAKAGT